MVGVWAPPNENDTEAYTRCVAKLSGFGIDEPLDLHDYACLKPILTAMIRVENGRQPYSDAQIDAALVRAGVMPPERSLQETRTVKGGQVAAAGTIGAGAIGAIQETVGQAHEALVGVVSYLDAAKWEPTRHPSTWRLALLSSLPHLHAEAFRLRTSLVSVDCQSPQPINLSIQPT